MNTIAVIDDDSCIQDMLREVLQKQGYRVISAYSGTEALLLLKEQQPDLILLDLMLPGLSGEELLPKVKMIPTIVVSAKTEIGNKVELLLNGASDYITKPFDIKELLARIVVQLRKNDQAQIANQLTFEELKLDLTLHEVTAMETKVHLTRTEFAILKKLMQNPHQVITKSVLLDTISVDTQDCVESSLKIHISNLRKKLREVTNQDYIESVWGIGFKLRES